MRSVLSEEMDFIWAIYNYKIKNLGFKKMMLTDEEELKKLFTLNYKDLYYLLKTIEKKVGKSRGEISYSVLKLRRLMAMWVNNNTWSVEGGITFSQNDVYNQFPLFNCQRPNVIPSTKTIRRLKAKCLHQYIDDFNANYQNNKLSNYNVKFIKNLRDLRSVLVGYEKFTQNQAIEIMKLYGKTVAKKEVNDYSNESIELSNI